MNPFTMQTGASNAAMTRILTVSLFLGAQSTSVVTLKATEVESAGARRSVAVQNTCAWPSLALMRDGTVVEILDNKPTRARILGKRPPPATITSQPTSPGPHRSRTVLQSVPSSRQGHRYSRPPRNGRSAIFRCRPLLSCCDGKGVHSRKTWSSSSMSVPVCRDH